MRNCLHILGYGDTGQWGERYTTRYLSKRGLQILALNWSSAGNEADIIGFQNKELIIVEVKTRKLENQELFPGSLSIDNTKILALHKVAGRFQRRNAPLLRRYRIQNVSFLLAEVYYKKYWIGCKRVEAIEVTRLRG